ncbi:UNVERIFIED_ORG: amino acid/polyamine/organocation transporter (APC superfamily) [Nocardia globerula]|uniref:Amino acid/polyamine/organocation transporter (APC superfamily) n=1 Tax=Nocardia globerula TaxID=1818 RepID=A0A652YVJ3_NOCGL|nr:APC family permease [Rhodococcus globerulus]NMD59919.1 APC family permease [Nocardia globerula]PVX63970.1 amino acid/polyamine/organocation transporter (APC superfamily) [Rhodococcus globerulus]
MSALTEAIARSFTTREKQPPARSPLRALGRRQLSGAEVLAQSVATTAPAVSMVVLPVTMLTHGHLLSGMITIIIATVLVTLIAFCISQFTRRMAASGGLHSFAFRGLGTRAAITTGIAILVKYVGSAVMTLYHGGLAVITLLGFAGIRVHGTFQLIALYTVLAALILACLLRSVRFAALAILVAESCSLLFIVALMLIGGDQHAQIIPSTSGHGLLITALAALFALAGFESAAFFGPEARRPLVTVTRTVLFTPMICGGLFIFAGWAAWTGRSDTLVNAYLHGTSTGVSPAVVIALNIGMGCSWLASSMASSNAASRLLYSFGVERLLPRAFAHVHSAFRTPSVALSVVVAAVLFGGGTFAVIGRGVFFEDLRLTVRAAVIVAYALVAISSVVFLTRIGEDTPRVLAAASCGSGAGAVVLGYLVYANIVDHTYIAPIAVLVILSSGTLWQFYLRRRSPQSLLHIGAFDRPETEDVLPGAGVFGTDAAGNIVLVGESAAGPR